MSATSQLLAQVDQVFRAGDMHTAAPPTRFYLNLTESCQLRCVHCITHAPARTADKTARHLTANVLEALRPNLKHALYVGLTHAGEPMLAPLFEDTLRAVKDARAGGPTVVHLLTNGQAMTPQRLREVCALGVNSLSISMDGMTAASHDLLRLGSRIEQLLPRIAELVRARTEDRLDLRLGLACTLHRANVGQTGELVHFAARAGVDWVKLEEMYPVHDVAAAAMAPPQDVMRAVAVAQREATSLGLRLLDHTREQPVWKCQLSTDQRMAAFSTGDDFINRMDINPCRLPWELVCVEPNGDLKPMSFHHPAAGNILERPLMETWNGRAFSAERVQSARARLCLGGPVTCPADVGPARW